MKKLVAKIDNSCVVVFDAAVLEQAHLKPGDELSIEVHDDGVITLTPLRTRKQLTEAQADALVAKTMKTYRCTLKKLA